jgi:hypothetical protein
MTSFHVRVEQRDFQHNPFHQHDMHDNCSDVEVHRYPRSRETKKKHDLSSHTHWHAEGVTMDKCSCLTRAAPLPTQTHSTNMTCTTTAAMMRCTGTAIGGHRAYLTCLQALTVNVAKNHNDSAGGTFAGCSVRQSRGSTAILARTTCSTHCSKQLQR